ncbi:MAG: metal-binding protein [Candidatus Eremiobacterota bacterium]
MATGKTHEHINIFLLILLVPLYLSRMKDWSGTAIFGLFYILGTFYFSPDLDMANTLPYRRWGFLKFIWYVYSKIIPHRSWISHSFFIGTLFRLLWFTACLFLSGFFIVWILHFTSIGNFSQSYIAAWLEIKKFCLQNKNYLIPAFLGLFLSSLLHQVVDVISTFFKRRF